MAVVLTLRIGKVAAVARLSIIVGVTAVLRQKIVTWLRCWAKNGEVVSGARLRVDEVARVLRLRTGAVATVLRWLGW
jgi:hypothetical protein